RMSVDAYFRCMRCMRVLLVVPMLIVAACDIHWLQNDSTKAAASKDSVTVSPVVVTAQPNPGAMPVDTLVGLAFGDSDVAAAVPLSPATPNAPNARADTSSVIATAAELQQLAATLDVPVQGVLRSQLK